MPSSSTRGERARGGYRRPYQMRLPTTRAAHQGVRGCEAAPPIPVCPNQIIVGTQTIASAKCDKKVAPARRYSGLLRLSVSILVETISQNVIENRTSAKERPNAYQDRSPSNRQDQPQGAHDGQD